MRRNVMALPWPMLHRPISSLRLFASLTLLLLSACVSVPRLSLPAMELPTGWSARQAALQAWARFDLRGKVSITRGEDNVVAALSWRQRGDALRVGLEGPLGMGASEWAFDSTRSDESIAELERRIGVALPITSVRYWALGVPDPALAVQSVEVIDERLQSLQQRGWSIRYLDYARVPGASFELPRRVQLDSAEVRVRIFIDSWESLGP